jgi:hypothetical protein
MTANLINILFGSVLKKIFVVGLSLALLFGAFQIRGCLRAKQELRAYKQADNIRELDRKTDQRIEEHKREVENYSTPDDLEHGFDRLRDYGK